MPDANTNYLTVENALKIVAGHFGLSSESLAATCRAVGVDTYYIWSSARGGGAAIVGPDGVPLYAGSLVSPEDHLVAFRAGKRSVEPSD